MHRYKDDFDTFNRMTSLLNAAGAHNDFSFFNILGDNFYDQEGDYTAQWFNALTLDVKSKVLGTVPGNHDFWVLGSPSVWTSKDQLGNGFMQFYGQDALSSKTSAGFPYNFTVLPTANETLPTADNFFYYNKLGNIGVIAYSGAHDYMDSIPMFEEACQWATEAQPEVILLLGMYVCMCIGIVG